MAVTPHDALSDVGVRPRQPAARRTQPGEPHLRMGSAPSPPRRFRTRFLPSGAFGLVKRAPSV